VKISFDMPPVPGNDSFLLSVVALPQARASIGTRGKQESGPMTVQVEAGGIVKELCNKGKGLDELLPACSGHKLNLLNA
jgi:hypothetical protein